MKLELFPGKHLFVDEYRIESMYAACRMLNPPVKHGDHPVFAPESPWEEQGIHLGRFLYDAEHQIFRLWYTSSASTVIGTRVLVKDNPPNKVHESHICYAESDDAIAWYRPDVGITEQERYPGNNIIMPSMRRPGRASLSEVVIDDPFDSDSEKRFKLMYMDQAEEGEVGGGLAPDQKLRLHAHSSDGVHWTQYPWEPHHVSRLFGVLTYLNEVPSGVLDPDARYILYGQRGSPWKTRQIGRRHSDDFINWSDNRPVLESRLSDTPGLEFYHMEGAIINQTYAGLHLATLGAYHTDLGRKYNPARNDGLTHPQLAYSRDSVRWERWDTTLIPRGEKGSFDWGGVYAGYPVVVGDRIYFMYTGESGRHGVRSLPTLGLATLRLDGFVSIQTTGYMPGIMVTRAHHWNAADVRLNVQSQNGDVRVQLQDETGKAFDGYSEEDCDLVHEDAINKTVSWKGNTDVQCLEGKMVALKMTICPGDKLYSYTLTPLNF